MNQGIEDGLPPNRRSFVGINRLGDVITGFFAHEDRRIGVQYDSHWIKQERSDEEFEHLFFALVLDQGQVVLQRKRVDREFVTINLDTMRRAFFDLLGTALQKAGFTSDQIRRQLFQQTRQKAEMLRIFDENQVTYIRVKELRGRRVPEEVRLFNPDVDKDTILRQVLNDDYQHMDELEASAGEEVGASNLREAKVIRGAMLTGEPQEVRAVIANQERTFRLKQRERFKMQLDTPVGEPVQQRDIERLIRIVRTEYFIPASLAESTASLGPLFDHMRDKDGNGSQ
jgi:hypothetical protein